MDFINNTMLSFRSKQSKATFQSYVENNGDAVNGIHGSARKTESCFYDPPPVSEAELKLKLLKGEVQLADAQKVCRYVPYSDEKSGHMGTLFVTNFKISFVTLTAVNGEELSPGRNKMIGPDDIALSNVLELYQVVKGKKKRLAPRNMVIEHVKRLEIHCKDFQLHNFCFRNAVPNNVKLVINTILHHAYPVRSDLLFAFSYQIDTEPPDAGKRPPAIDYCSEEDWQIELRRMNVGDGFRICHANHDQAVINSLPDVFVIPSSLTDNDLKNFFSKKHSCIPVWCYTHRNSCSLFRLTSDKSENSEKRALKWVSECHPKGKTPVVCDLGKTMPSLRDLQTSYEKLRELCLPSTSKDLWNSDVGWNCALEASLWLNRISSALSIVCQIIEDVTMNANSVVLKEPTTSDFIPLVSSLTQLLLDPPCRTTHGFERLIEREWVVFGHQFASRCGLICQKDSEQSPVFLFFLDCTWQLLQQFPASFQFSEIYLISIWDSVTLGLFRNFVHSDLPSRHRTASQLLSVWNWQSQFDKDNIGLFDNPLFTARSILTGKKFDEAYYWTMPRSAKGGADRKNDRSQVLGLSLTTPCIGNIPTTSVLMPKHQIIHLHIWAGCYLRWLTPVQIVDGGQPAEYFTQCTMLDEIRQLEDNIKKLEVVRTTSRNNPQLSEEATTSRQADGYAAVSRSVFETPHNRISSSFPFAPCRPVTATAFLGVPTTPQTRMSFVEETMSVDELSISDSVEC